MYILRKETLRVCIGVKQGSPATLGWSMSTSAGLQSSPSISFQSKGWGPQLKYLLTPQNTNVFTVIPSKKSEFHFNWLWALFYIKQSILTTSGGKIPLKTQPKYFIRYNNLRESLGEWDGNSLQYSPCGHKGSDMTEWLTHTHTCWDPEGFL